MASLLILIGFLHANAAPVAASQIDVSSASVLLAFAGGFAAFSALAAGLAQGTDADPFVLAVFASPISPLSIGRYRVLRLVAGTIAAASAFAAGGAYLGSISISWPLGDTALRIEAIAVPFGLAWSMAGVLLAGLTPRWKDRVQNLLGGAALAAVSAVVVWIIVLGPRAFAGLLDLSTRVAGPAVRWILGRPPDLEQVLALGITAALAFGLTCIAWGRPYPTPPAFGVRGTEGDLALGPERATTDDFLTRLRGRLRFRYRDAGLGTRALEGEVLTLALRSGDVVLLGLILALSIAFVATTVGFGPSAAGNIVTIGLLGLVVWFGAPLLGVAGAPYRVTLLEQVRQLPFGERATLSGLLSFKRRLIFGIAVVLGAVVGSATLDPLLATLSGTLTASVLYLAVLMFTWGAPAARPLNAPSGETSLVPWLLILGGLVALLPGESLFGLFLPSPSGWNPLWIPFSISSLVNLLAIRQLTPVVAHRLTGPARQD